MDDATQPEQRNRLAKNWFAVDIQAQHVVTEAFGDVKEIP